MIRHRGIQGMPVHASIGNPGAGRQARALNSDQNANISIQMDIR